MPACRLIQKLGQQQHTVFSVTHLRKLVARGRWGEALSYVRRFLPLLPGDIEGLALVLFLTALRSLANPAGSSTVEVISVEQRRVDATLLVWVCHSAMLSSYDTTVTILNSPQHRRTPTMQFEISATAAAEDDYPCMRRLRHRRLLAYLHNQGFEAAFHSLIQELGQQQHTVFSVTHLWKLVARGRWGEALSYVRRFLPLPPSDVEGHALILFLTMLRSLANPAGSSAVEVISTEQRRVDATLLVWVCRSAMLSSYDTTITMLNSPQHRASLDWELVKKEASTIAHDLALESPELSRREVLRQPVPGGVLLPIFCPYQRRRFVRTQARRPTASAIAKLCLGLNNKKSNKRRSLPSSSGPLPDKCLKAGKLPELHQVIPLQPTRIQGLNQEESTCILYVENHCRLNPNNVLVDIGGYRLNAQNLKCLTIDKTHDGRDKFIPTNVTRAYTNIIRRHRANWVLSKRSLFYDLGWAQDIPSMLTRDVSMMQSTNLLDHAMFLIQTELVFLPMTVGEHIILLVINNKSKQFQVLDSERAYSRYQSQINETIRGIKNLLDIARSRGIHEVPDVTNWPVNQIYHIPPQEDGCSCALFALKYIELWDGERLSISFNQSDIHSFRVQVLVELLLSELNVMTDVKSELRRLFGEAK